MTLEALFEPLDRNRKELTVYTGAANADLVDRFAARNADVGHRTLPGDEEGFVVVREDGFAGALPIGELRRTLEGPIPDPWELDDVYDGYRELFALLDNTVFTRLDRRRLLVASRGIEEHAWRVGAGTLCAGFQSVDAFRRQRPVYERLADETVLDVHVYVDTVPENAPPAVTFHTEPADEARRFWFVGFDGSGDDARKCAVVGRQRDPGTYAGFWTYDPPTVESVFDAVPTGR